MHIETKFDYPALSRSSGPNGRRYVVDAGRPLPSVTTILAATADKTHLDEWAVRVGPAEAERIKEEAAALGQGMHQNLENYILGKPITGQYMTKVLANVIIKQGLSRVDIVWGTEVGMFCKDLYAGTADLVGIHQGTPAIMDFKNSLNDKKSDWIQDYYAQLAAYAMAHNEMFGTNIRKGVVMIATRAAKYQEFIIEGDMFTHYETVWANKVCAYYEQFGIN